jgi:hypothetical protein
MRFKISRRAFLLGGPGIAVAAGTGLLAFEPVVRPHSHVERALRRLFGPVNMARADLARFSADFDALLAAKDFSLKKVRAVGAVEAMDLVPLAKRRAPEMVARGVEKFDRELVTAFLTSTTYLEVLAAGGAGRVVYNGLQEACASPFATFDFPEA